MKDKLGIVFRLLALLAVGAAVILQVIFVMLDCQLVSYIDQDGEERGLGLFKVQEPSSGGSSGSSQGNSISRALWEPSQDCTEYNWSNADGLIRAAQYSNFLAIVAGGLGCFLILCETFCLRVCCSQLLETILFNLAIIFSGLVFLVFTSDTCDDANGDCSLNRGGIINIVATALYALASLIMCCTPKPQPVFRQLCCPKKHGDDKDIDETEGVDDVETGHGRRLGRRGRHGRGRRIRRTPSAVIGEFEDDSRSLSGLMTVETKQDKSLSSPAPVGEFQNGEGNTSYDYLTIDGSLDTPHHKKTSSAAVREQEAENMEIPSTITSKRPAGVTHEPDSSTDPIIIPSPRNKGKHVSLSNVMEADNETDTSSNPGSTVASCPAIVPNKTSSTDTMYDDNNYGDHANVERNLGNVPTSGMSENDDSAASAPSTVCLTRFPSWYAANEENGAADRSVASAPFETGRTMNAEDDIANATVASAPYTTASSATPSSYEQEGRTNGFDDRRAPVEGQDSNGELGAVSETSSLSKAPSAIVGESDRDVVFADSDNTSPRDSYQSNQAFADGADAGTMSDTASVGSAGLSVVPVVRGKAVTDNLDTVAEESGSANSSDDGPPIDIVQLQTRERPASIADIDKVI